MLRWRDALVIGFEGETLDEFVAVVPGGEGWFGVAGGGGGEG